MKCGIRLTFISKCLELHFEWYVSVCRSFFDEALEAIPPLTNTADKK